MGVVALATYSHGCEGRSPSLKTLIRCWNLLQDLSTLYLQSAFFSGSLSNSVDLELTGSLRNYTIMLTV